MAGRPVVSAWVTHRSVEIIAKKLCTSVLTSSSLKSDLEDRAQALADYLNVNDDLDITHGVNPYRVINVKQWKVLPFKNYTANQYRVSFTLPLHNDQPPTRISYTPKYDVPMFDKYGNIKSYSQRMEDHKKMEKRVKTYHWTIANMAAVRLGKGGQDVVYPKKSSTLVWFTKNGHPIFRKKRMKFGMNAESGYSQYRRFIINSIERFFGHSIGVGNLDNDTRPISNKSYSYGTQKANLKMMIDSNSNSNWNNSMLGKDMIKNTMFTPDGNYKSYSDRMTIHQMRMSHR